MTAPSLVAIRAFTWTLCVAASAAAGAAEDVSELVANLDTQYQLAVKNRDVATMDRILADDFVLVTGRGKTFTKADLLNDARRGGTVYEHQEDSEQTLRVWGDTAVVTALLWAKGTAAGSRSSTGPGSATPWCVRPRAGATFLASLRFGCPMSRDARRDACATARSGSRDLRRLERP